MANRGYGNASNAERFSYVFVATALIGAWLLHMGGPLVITLFSFFALKKLNFGKARRKWLAVVLFLVVIAGAAYGLGFFINRMVRELPEIADKAIPLVIEWAKQQHIELPFTDYDSLKDVALDEIKGQAHYFASFARFARGATSVIVLCALGVVIAIGLFLNPRFEGEGDRALRGNNLYSICCEAILERMRLFYESFATVMGAQLVISAINTVLTAIFVMIVHLPHGIVVIGATFLCGLLPIIGNVLSNSIIVGIGVTVSFKMAITCLVFLVVVHKLEYFLNSKIVGGRIRNPFWLTLLALILGERLMGIPGMVLAPVVLNYVKMEAARRNSSHPAPTSRETPSSKLQETRAGS